MKKRCLLASVLLFLLLLSSCGQSTETYFYQDSGHEHTFGAPYAVAAVTCLEAGSCVRYCAVCREGVEETISVSEDIADRSHAFSDTVVAPTESESGYTIKCCTLCGYTVERTEEVPPLYALLQTEDTVAVAPAGVSAVLMSDSKSHLLALSANADAPVDADVARRLAVALTVTEWLETDAETGLFGPEKPITVVTGALAGRTYTVKQLLFAWIKEGSPDIARALSDIFADSEAAFFLRVSGRLERLGLSETTNIHPVSRVNAEKTTLYDTAVLLARALDTPILCEALADAVPDLAQIGGAVPAVYLESETKNLRISAIAREDGFYVFLLLHGETLPEGTEETLLAP